MLWWHVCTLFQRGTKAPQAAGRIHTDMEKGFIMAESMAFADFKEAGSEQACKVRIFISLNLNYCIQCNLSHFSDFRNNQSISHQQHF